MSTNRLYRATKEYIDIQAVVEAATKSTWTANKTLPFGSELQIRFSNASRELHKAMEEAKAIMEAKTDSARRVAKRIAGERDVCWHLLTLAANHGFQIRVSYGDEALPWTNNVDVALNAIMDVEACHVYFRNPNVERSDRWVYIVLGNSPAEVIADYSVPEISFLLETHKYIRAHYDSDYPMGDDDGNAADQD